jgi:hypothetical protein
MPIRALAWSLQTLPTIFATWFDFVRVTVFAEVIETESNVLLQTAQLSDSEKSLRFVPFDLIILDTTDLLQHGASTTLLKRLLSPQGTLPQVQDCDETKV